MKHLRPRPVEPGVHVAPHAGARIETSILRNDNGEIGLNVAPHAGARIETSRRAAGSASTMVAPHAGARIETMTCKWNMCVSACRPPRGGAD